MPERRKHRMFLTRHSEYHLRDDECVGVRDRESGVWDLDHAALRLRLLRLPAKGQDFVLLGRRLQFWGSSMDVLTSPVLAFARPPKACLLAYVSMARSGEIES